MIGLLKEESGETLHQDSPFVHPGARELLNWLTVLGGPPGTGLTWLWSDDQPERESTCGNCFSRAFPVPVDIVA